jgi:hypothetical protein
MEAAGTFEALDGALAAWEGENARLGGADDQTVPPDLKSLRRWGVGETGSPAGGLGAAPPDPSGPGQGRSGAWGRDEELDDETPAVFRQIGDREGDLALPAYYVATVARKGLGLEPADPVESLDDADYDPVNDPARKAAATLAAATLAPAQGGEAPDGPDDVFQSAAEPLDHEPVEPPASGRPVAPEGTLSILEPEVVVAPDGTNPSLTLEPSLEPQVEIEPVIESGPLMYNPPRPASKGKFSAEASTAVIVNYLEDSDDNFIGAQGQAGQLAEEDDLDIDLMDMHAHEPIRLAAKPMVPAPKVPL